MKLKTNKLIGLFAILIILDQATKYIFQTSIDLGIIAITPITNTGMSFGLFNGNNIAFILITTVIILTLIIFRKEFKETPIQYTLIIAGAIGNLTDRILHGYVLDFINFKFFPIFNIADTLIFLGVTGIIIHEIKNQIKEHKQNTKKKLNKNKTKKSKKKKINKHKT